MQIVKQILSVLIATLILFGSVGINMHLHFCKISKKTSIEILCKKKTTESDECCVKSCCSNSMNEKTETKLNNESCCLDNFLFYKINSYSGNELAYLVSLINFNKFFNESKIDFINSFFILKSEFIKFYSPPPPKFFGKELLHFIQNIKIPFSAF